MVPIADCNDLLATWNQNHFTYELSHWENSTALADHFFVLGTNGSCQFALKRLDGLNNTIMSVLTSGTLKRSKWDSLLIFQTHGTGSGIRT